MKKIIIIVLIILIVVLCSCTLCATAETTTKIEHTSLSARKGDEIELYVSISEKVSIRSISLEPQYDSRLLKFVDGTWLVDDALIADWNVNEQNGVLLFASEKEISGVVAKYKLKIMKTDNWSPLMVSSLVVLRNLSGEVLLDVKPGIISIICDHTWDNVIYKLPSSCTEYGYSYRKCTECGSQDIIETFQKLEHTQSDWIIDREPTEEEYGERHIECINCGLILKKSDIPKLNSNILIPLWIVYVVAGVLLLFIGVLATLGICLRHGKKN